LTEAGNGWSKWRKGLLRRPRKKVSELGQCEHHQGRERLKEFAESRDRYCQQLQRNGRTDAKRKITERRIQLKDMGEVEGDRGTATKFTQEIRGLKWLKRSKQVGITPENSESVKQGHGRSRCRPRKFQEVFDETAWMERLREVETNRRRPGQVDSRPGLDYERLAKVSPGSRKIVERQRISQKVEKCRRNWCEAEGFWEKDRWQWRKSRCEGRNEPRRSQIGYLLILPRIGLDNSRNLRNGRRSSWMKNQKGRAIDFSMTGIATSHFCLGIEKWESKSFQNIPTSFDERSAQPPSMNQTFRKMTSRDLLCEVWLNFAKTWENRFFHQSPGSVRRLILNVQV
jgi:hypothetical protein